jgi:hypothetical protein
VSQERTGVPSFPEHFQALRQQYFDPLRDKLGLTDERTSQAASSGFASVSGAAGSIRVHFESDRGLCSYLVGFSGDDHDFCSVETLADRFPRIRLMPDGQQRLSLEEQSSFLCDRWADLQVMFSPDHARETRAWRDAHAAALTRKFTRDT